MAIILASASPRRKELLRFITEEFTVSVSDADETTDPEKTPEETVKELAKIKCEAVSLNFPEDTVIGADTVVVIDNRILGKPADKKEAYAMLRSLSGRSHYVYTGVHIKSCDKSISFAEKTEVSFFDLSDEEINAYIATNEPFDKAGSYGIQGKGSTLIRSITGDYFNVVGLPVAKLNRELKKHGLI